MQRRQNQTISKALMEQPDSPHNINIRGDVPDLDDPEKNILTEHLYLRTEITRRKTQALLRVIRRDQ